MKSFLFFLVFVLSPWSQADRSEFKSLYVLPGFSVGYQVDFNVFNKVYPRNHPVFGKRKFKREGMYEYPGFLKIKMGPKSKALQSLEILSDKALDHLATLEGGAGLKKMKSRLAAWSFEKAYGKSEAKTGKDWVLYKDQSGPEKNYSLSLSVERRAQAFKSMKIQWRWAGSAFSEPLAKKSSANKKRTQLAKKTKPAKGSARFKKAAMLTDVCSQQILSCANKPGVCKTQQVCKSPEGRFLLEWLVGAKNIISKKNAYQPPSTKNFTKKAKGINPNLLQTLEGQIVYQHFFSSKIGPAWKTNDFSRREQSKKNQFAYALKGLADFLGNHGLKKAGHYYSGVAQSMYREIAFPEMNTPSVSWKEALKRFREGAASHTESTFKKASDWKAKGYNQNQINEENARRALQRQKK